MKKIIASVILVFALVFGCFSVSAEAVSVSASAAIVICADSGDIVFQKNIHQKLPMASTTKIMTALILAGQPDLSKTVTVTREMVSVEGSSMGLLPGDTVSYRDLLYGMLLASGNDAANTTAYILGGSVEGFAKLMNKKAEELGLTNTNFVTPSGLDADNHYTTAYDLARLATAALKNKYFRQACSSSTATLCFGNPPYNRTFKNHNRLLETYEGMVGVKTGFTKKSGRCLVTAAERDGVCLVAVTLNAPNDWDDHKIMLDYGFSNVRKITFDNSTIADSIPVIAGDCDRVKIRAASAEFTVSANNTSTIRREIFLPQFIYSGISAGEKVGSVEYYIGDTYLGSNDIISIADVEVKNPAPPFRERFFENIKLLLRLII